MEVIIVFILFVLAPLAVFRGIKMLRDSSPARERSERASSGASSAMRKSELEALIQDAVIDATAPLAARIDELERELLLGDGRLDASTISEAFDDDLAPEASGSNELRARDRA